MLELPVMLPAAHQSLYRLMMLPAQRPRKILTPVGDAGLSSRCVRAFFFPRKSPSPMTSSHSSELETIMEFIKMDGALKAIPTLPAETCIQHDTSIALILVLVGTNFHALHSTTCVCTGVNYKLSAGFSTSIH